MSTNDCGYSDCRVPGFHLHHVGAAAPSDPAPPDDEWVSEVRSVSMSGTQMLAMATEWADIAGYVLVRGGGLQHGDELAQAPGVAAIVAATGQAIGDTEVFVRIPRRVAAAVPPTDGETK